MKKPSVIIGKKQIILTCMTLMLGIAVYVNYALSDGSVIEKEAKTANGEISAVMDNEAATGEASDENKSEDAEAENYGESKFCKRRKRRRLFRSGKTRKND